MYDPVPEGRLINVIARSDVCTRNILYYATPYRIRIRIRLKFPVQSICPAHEKTKTVRKPFPGPRIGYFYSTKGCSKISDKATRLAFPYPHAVPSVWPYKLLLRSCHLLLSVVVLCYRRRTDSRVLHIFPMFKMQYTYVYVIFNIRTYTIMASLDRTIDKNLKITLCGSWIPGFELKTLLLDTIYYLLSRRQNNT